ncbi:MAG: hypothetical protein ABIN73_03830 [candidate division WOR-3 bacterium]
MNRKLYFKLFIIHFLTNFLFLLNYDGVYWDDYALYNQNFKTIYEMFKDHSGYLSLYFSYLHFILLKAGIFIYRILVFLLYFFNTIFLYEILKKLNFLSENEKLSITLLFMLSPLCFAKISLMHFTYVFNLPIFYFAFFLLSIYIESPSFLKRIIILILFFISFTTNSLLVFYLLPIAYLFYLNYNSKTSFTFNFLKFLKNNIDFLILPLIYWFLRLTYFKPSGLYEGYNAININLRTPFYILISLFTNLIEPLDLSFSHSFSLWYITIFLILIFYFLFDEQFEKSENNEDKLLNLKFLMGIIIFLISVLPYILVQKIPSLWDWDSRHQLLLPLGFSFIVYFGSKILLTKFLKLKFNNFILYFFLSSFLIENLIANFKYHIDFFYQLSIIENMKKNESIKNNYTFVVKTELKDKLAFNRWFRSYELNGMSKIAFGIDNKLFIPENIDLNSDFNFYKPYKQYNFSNWDPGSFQNKKYIVIKENPDTPFFNFDKKFFILFPYLKYYLKLNFYKIFKPTYFKREISKLVIIEAL